MVHSSDSRRSLYKLFVSERSTLRTCDHQCDNTGAAKKQGRYSRTLALDIQDPESHGCRRGSHAVSMCRVPGMPCIALGLRCCNTVPVCCRTRGPGCTTRQVRSRPCSATLPRAHLHHVPHVARQGVILRGDLQPRRNLHAVAANQLHHPPRAAAGGGHARALLLR